MRTDVAERRRERLAREPAATTRPDHFAAEAKPAVDRAHVGELEQHAIGIAVNDPLDRAVRVVADRVGGFHLQRVELPDIGDELPGNGVAWIGRIDALGDLGRDRDRIAGSDPFDLTAALGRHQSGGDQIVGAAQRLAGCGHSGASWLAR